MKAVRRSSLAVAIAPVLALTLSGACSNDNDDKKDAKAALTTAPKTPRKGTPVCDEMKLIGDLDRLVGSFDPSDPKELAEGISLAVNRLNALAKVAPDDLEKDVITLRDLIQKMGEAFAKVDPTKPEQALSVLAELRVELEAGKGASDRVNEFAKTQCGIDLNPPTSSTSSTSTTAAPA